MEKLEHMLNGFQVEGAGFLLFVVYVVVRVNIVFGYQNFVKCQPVKMKLSTDARVPFVTRMVGSVRHIGLIGKWGGMIPAV